MPLTIEIKVDGAKDFFAYHARLFFKVIPACLAAYIMLVAGGLCSRLGCFNASWWLINKVTLLCDWAFSDICEPCHSPRGQA